MPRGPRHGCGGRSRRSWPDPAAAGRHGVSFLVVDGAHAHIGPAASWFASDAVRDAFGPVLDRP